MRLRAFHLPSPQWPRLHGRLPRSHILSPYDAEQRAKRLRTTLSVLAWMVFLAAAAALIAYAVQWSLANPAPYESYSVPI